MRKNLIFKYISDDEPEVVLADWNLALRKYFTINGFEFRMGEGELRAVRNDVKRRLGFTFFQKTLLVCMK